MGVGVGVEVGVVVYVRAASPVAVGLSLSLSLSLGLRRVRRELRKLQGSPSRHCTPWRFPRRSWHRTRHIGTHLASITRLPRPLRVGELPLDAAREVVVAVVQALVRAHTRALLCLGNAMAGVLDALDLADAGEARVVVGHALRAGCHDGCECGIFRVAPHARNRMLTGPCF